MGLWCRAPCKLLRLQRDQFILLSSSTDSSEGQPCVMFHALTAAGYLWVVIADTGSSGMSAARHGPTVLGSVATHSTMECSMVNAARSLSSSGIKMLQNKWNFQRPAV